MGFLACLRSDFLGSQSRVVHVVLGKAGPRKVCELEGSEDELAGGVGRCSLAAGHLDHPGLAPTHLPASLQLCTPKVPPGHRKGPPSRPQNSQSPTYPFRGHCANLASRRELRLSTCREAGACLQGRVQGREARWAALAEPLRVPCQVTSSSLKVEAGHCPCDGRSPCDRGDPALALEHSRTRGIAPARRALFKQEKQLLPPKAPS